MSRIRSKNTKIELSVFSELRKRGIYFQRHYKRAFGNPDIAFPRTKKAIFIDGDFWHGYKFSLRKKRLPGKWFKKIKGNIIRDREKRLALKESGWKILRLWEHEIEGNFQNSISKIKIFLKDN